MRVIVCGSRSWADKVLVFKILRGIDARYGIQEVVHGGAPGADAMASEWCIGAEKEESVFAADWKRKGKRAGILRNAEMAKEGADLCVAFWDGSSRGTLDMITRATRAGIPVRVIPRVRT